MNMKNTRGIHQIILRFNICTDVIDHHLCQPSDGDLHVVLLDWKCFQVKTGVLRMPAVYDIPAHN